MKEKKIIIKKHSLKILELTKHMKRVIHEIYIVIYHRVFLKISILKIFYVWIFFAKTKNKIPI